MNAVDPRYMCQCTFPHPHMEHGQDSGLCQSCSFIYDERLYEARLRQYTPNYTYDSIHEYLLDVDPNYKALVG